MTYREKLVQDRPDLTGPDYIGGCYLCPVNHGYERKTICPPEFLDMPPAARCWHCWDREMKDT